MAHPEYVYWGLLLLIAVPLAPFNAAACVLLGMRLANQYTYSLGWPEAGCQMAVYSTGAAIGFALSRGRCCDVVAGLSVMLAIIAAAFSQSRISEAAWWWSVFAVAIVQVLIVPLCTDREAVRATLKAVRDPSSINRLRLSLARLAW